MTSKNHITELSPYIAFSCLVVGLILLFTNIHNRNQVSIPNVNNQVCTRHEPICFEEHRLTVIDVDSKSRTASFVDEYGADIGTFYIGDPNFWNTNP